MRGPVVGTATLRALALLAALLGSSPAPAARADALDDRLAGATKAYVERLEALATWCDENHAAGQRDGVFRRILLLAPDHARARSGLRFKRDKKTSAWTQPPDYKPPVDFNKGAAAEVEKRIHDAGIPYRDEVTEALASGSGITPGRREAIREHLVDVLPDDADLRRGRGDVQRRDGRWVLPETVATSERTAHLREAARKAWDAAAPTDDPIAATGGWGGGFRVGGRRVRGAVPAAEIREAARLVAATDVFAREVLGNEGTPALPSVVVLLPDRAAARTFIEKNHDGEDMLADLDHFIGMLLPSGTVIEFSKEPENRAANLAGALVNEAVEIRVHVRPPWLLEGLVQRITWYLLHRHGAGFGESSGTNRPSDDPDEQPPPADPELWLAKARDAIDRAGARGFRLLFTRALNAFRGVDRLMAYGLVAYLLEARADALRPFLDAVRNAESPDPDALFAAAFSVDTDVVYWRLRRWLLEVASER